MGRTVFAWRRSAFGIVGAIGILAGAFGGGIKQAKAQLTPGDGAAIVQALQAILAELQLHRGLHEVRNVELAEIKVINSRLLAAIGPIEQASTVASASDTEVLGLMQEVVPDMPSLIDEKDFEVPQINNFGDLQSKASQMFGIVGNYRKLFENIKEGKLDVKIKLPDLATVNSRRRAFLSDAVSRQFSFSMNSFDTAGKAESARRVLDLRRNSALTVQHKLAANGAALTQVIKQLNHLSLAMAHANYSQSTAGIMRVPNITEDAEGAGLSATPPPNGDDLGSLK